MFIDGPSRLGPREFSARVAQADTVWRDSALIWIKVAGSARIEDSSLAIGSGASIRCAAALPQTHSSASKELRMRRGIVGNQCTVTRAKRRRFRGPAAIRPGSAGETIAVASPGGIRVISFGYLGKQTLLG